MTDFDPSSNSSRATAEISQNPDRTCRQPAEAHQDQPQEDFGTVHDGQIVERLLITPQEAAHMLSISARKLWSLQNAGVIPCVRLGRCVRYSPEDLEDWILNQRKRSR